MAGERQGRESGAPRVSTLLRAVQRGDYGVLTNLLGSSNGEDHEGNANNLGLLAALLVEACGREHLDCIELLLQKMMKPSPKRNLKRRGYFPMHTAAGAGATESIELLLSAGLSPKTRDRSGRTPLHLAAAQGSAECVSLLCAVARSTVVSRDRATGDTPVHFAARARNGVCIEVLLSYARGAYDILRETNTRGETPLDIATALGDTSLILCSGHATSGRGTACSEGGVNIQRIMAVWERFFENAAVACVGGRDATRAPGVPARNQQGQVATGHHQATARKLEVGGWVKLSNQPVMTMPSVKEVSVATTAWGNDARAGVEKPIRSRDEEMGWSEGEADIPSLAAGIRDRQLSCLPPGTSAVPRARICAWEGKPTDPVGDQEDEHIDGYSRQQPTPHQRTTDELHVQLENEEPILSSDDIDLHLFQTPRGGSGAEKVWLSESFQGETRSTSEPPADNESSGDTTAVAGSPLHRHQAWVACWDATSESMYYWDSESGEFTWNAPAPADGFHEVQSCVWDPQRGSFFTIDESGTSHWLKGSTIEGRAAIEDAKCLGTFVPSVQVANYGRVDSGSTGSTTRSSWQGFGGSTAGVAEGSPSTVAAGFRDNLYATVAEGEEEEIATGRALLQAKPKPEAGCQPVGRLPNDLNGFDYPGEEDRSDGVEFFDSRTCEDPCYLSAWVLWCTKPCHHKDDEPPYFVNEETNTSSWVLPPEAVATSGGWLRAWSEEHHAWFYANHWTGRVTWELQDLEIEGVVNSLAHGQS